MREDTEKRLNAIRTKLDSFFEKQFKDLNMEIKNIAKALGEFLKKPVNMRAVCRQRKISVSDTDLTYTVEPALSDHLFGA